MLDMDDEEDALLRACIPTQDHLYDVEEHDTEYVDIAIPLLFQTNLLRSPSVSGDEEGLESTDASTAADMHLPIFSLHWFDDVGASAYTTYALRVCLPLVDVVVFLLGFVSKEATILEIDMRSWSATVDFGDALVVKLRAQPWLTGLLLEFEKLAGDEAGFQDAVAQIGAFITEMDLLWMSAYPLEFSMQ